MNDNQNSQRGAAPAEVLIEVVQLLRRAALLLERVAVAPQPPPRGEPPADAPTSAPPLDERATTKQVGAIFAIARRQGQARDRITALVRDRTGKNKVEHLTRAEASALIGELDGRNGASA